MLVAAVKSGASPAAAKARGIAWGEQAVGPLVDRYLPLASDAAQTAFVDGSIGVLRAFDKQGDDSCYRRMFPVAGAPPPALPKLDPAQEKKMVDAMTLVFESAMAGAPSSVSKADAEAAMQGFVVELGKKRGAAFLTALGAMAEQTQDLQARRRACATAITLYEEALTLPPEQRRKVLRAMFPQP